MIRSVINIEVPRHHVFSVLADFANYQEWLPGCSVSKVLNSTERSVETEFTIKSIKSMVLGLRFEMEPSQLMTFKMVKGSDLKKYEGSWRLMDSADGSGTVVMGDIDMDAGAMVPKFMVSRMAKKAIEETGKALKKRVQVVPLDDSKEAAPALPADRRRRAKRILHIVRFPDGYRVWLMGQSFFVRAG